MQALLLVGLGGFLGAISRYGLSLIIALIPFNIITISATVVLLVNLSGSFIAGLLVENLKSYNVTLFLTTGFLGSFTTFSAFSKESIFLLENKNLLWFFGFVIANVVGALLSFVLGYYLNR